MAMQHNNSIDQTKCLKTICMELRGILSVDFQIACPYSWWARYVIAAMFDDFDKGFSLFAILIISLITLNHSNNLFVH